MKKPLVLIAIALLGGGSGPANSQQPPAPNIGELDAPSAPAKEGPRAANQEQEAEIKRLIEDFVITEKEVQSKAAEQIRSDKARAEAERKARDEAAKSGNPDDDPFFGVTNLPPDLDDTPPEVLKELRGYYKIRDDAFKRLTAFKDLAFPQLVAHLDDGRPSEKYWNHSRAKTVGRMCYRVIHDQLTEFPPGYTEYGWARTGSNGQSHVKPYWAGTPYDGSGGTDAADDLRKWLQQNQNLSYSGKRVKCLTWQLGEEKKIGVIDPHGYYVNILPLELEILELQAAAGQDVSNELARVRILSKTRPANQVPKELMPVGPLPEIEKMHSLQETSAMLKTCPDGHTTLKDIPILYGTFPLLTKDPADWNDEDKALAKRRDANEIILGGELDQAEDPRFQTGCLTCGYQYRIMEAPDLGANWFKNGRKVSDFTTPFSPFSLSLPFAGMPDADISVEVNKKGRVVADRSKSPSPPNKKPNWWQSLRNGSMKTTSIALCSTSKHHHVPASTNNPWKMMTPIYISTFKPIPWQQDPITYVLERMLLMDL